MTLPDSWETWMLVKKQQFESYMEQLTGSKLGKELWKVCILLPCLFNLYAEYIMWNARLDESQAEIKISRRNINNLIYADDTTLVAESDDELKNFLMRVKEESEKADWKLNIQKTKIMASGPITSWQIEGEKVEAVTNFIFLGSKIIADGDCSHEMERHLLLGREAMTNLIVVQSLSHVWPFATPWTVACQASLSFTISWSLSIELVVPSNYLDVCHPLLLLLSIFPSIRVFSNKTAFCIRWPKYWSFSFSISPSNEYSGQFPLGLTGLTPLQSKVLSRVTSHIPQLKSIDFLALRLLYGPTLTSIHDYWKNHSFD